MRTGEGEDGGRGMWGEARALALSTGGWRLPDGATAAGATHLDGTGGAAEGKADSYKRRGPGVGVDSHTEAGAGGRQNIW